MSELTLTIMRLGLLVALWLFVFSIVGVLRGDLYGTRITNRRPAKKGTGRGRAAAGAATGAAVGAGSAGSLGSDSGPNALPARGGFFGGRRATPPASSS